ncbi:MAG: IS4 family transposase, partial [Gammaproteobacteria bacterium]
MCHSNTILNQLLNLFSRHEFERLAREHHKGAKLRTATRWSQFVYLLTGQ